MSLPAKLIAAVVDPPRGCADLPDVGGVIRARLDDFVVEELPAYESDGRPGHLLLTLKKRGLTTEEALGQLSRRLQVPRAEIGLAGLKDRDAVTRQRVSVPDRAAAALAGFSHPNIELGEPEPHSHKLRRGHLRGNRFAITIRGTKLPPDEALRHAKAKLEQIERDGLRNYYGAQRFGNDGRNLAPGLAALAGKGPPRAKADLVVSAGQSALFNLYLAERAERGLLGTVMLGDILQKRETGGMFECSDPAEDQRRLDAGELSITGPMFGSKMRRPSPGTPSDALESEVLELAGLARAKLDKLGRKVPGARRPLLIRPEQVTVELAPEVAGLGPGLELRFVLPPGSYATVLVRELCG
ncbi:MAG TPA: tRNA pseudouridine(13) synthase TruD [Enhygromyxa sp.]|nr:tRNA pseudouridine(13) synthase TruD [Enhygromyxa sp.]